MKIYEMVTERIIQLLEQGIIPWRRPWRSGAAVSWKSQKAYRGINALMLEPGEYATFKQVVEAGGTVKRGTKGQIVIYWNWLEKENEETGEVEEVPLLRYYKVFNIKTQCEGLASRRNDDIFDHDPIEAAERICAGYADAPPVRYASGRAFYRPSTDTVSVPPLCDYAIAQEYYSTLFHEFVHSTGHSSRLKRPLDEIAAFGDEKYSKEELIAEMGAAMLCGVAHIDNHTIKNSANYIGGWLRKLKEDDKRLVVQAAAKAQKAADYILGMTYDEDRTAS